MTASLVWRRRLAAVHQGDVYEVLTAHIGGDPQLAQATLDVAVLAGAIVHAADLGAKVINVSTITCLPADRMVDQAAGRGDPVCGGGQGRGDRGGRGKHRSERIGQRVV